VAPDADIQVDDEAKLLRGRQRGERGH
jgi:hypothetical protein